MLLQSLFQMKRVFIINFLSDVVIIYLTILASQITAFEESIFEDEDINRVFLPPALPHTGITAPGTKWCGPGNTSSSYNDLGVQRETDMCCRDHDHCDEILEPRSSAHGLNNTSWLPILKCSCEQKFINCLQAVNNMVSNTLGHVYYGARKHCMADNYPIISCKQYQKGTFRKRCIRYNINKNEPKIWQFFDMPFYISNSQVTDIKDNRETKNDLP